MVRTVVMVSGGGTNLQAILDARDAGKIKSCEIAAVVSSGSGAYALKRAENAGIPAFVVERGNYSTRLEFTMAMLEKLNELKTELVVHAGFLYILDPPLIRAYENRIINIHPSLIPAFSGPGYYGLRVHEAALAHGVKLTGATAHFVSEITDDGPIILQKAVPILEGDTPAVLQRRVMEEAEWQILPEAISLFCEGRLDVDGRTVRIKSNGQLTVDS